MVRIRDRHKVENYAPTIPMLFLKRVQRLNNIFFTDPQSRLTFRAIERHNREFVFQVLPLPIGMMNLTQVALGPLLRA